MARTKLSARRRANPGKMVEADLEALQKRRLNLMSPKLKNEDRPASFASALKRI
jgi:hypothetical protein